TTVVGGGTGVTWVGPVTGAGPDGGLSGSVSVNWPAVAPFRLSVCTVLRPWVRNSGSAVPVAPNVSVPPLIVFPVTPPPTLATSPVVTIVPPAGAVTVTLSPTTSRALIVAPRVTLAVALTLLAS